MGSGTELLCYNRGCGQKFAEQDNNDGNNTTYLPSFSLSRLFVISRIIIIYFLYNFIYKILACITLVHLFSMMLTKGGVAARKNVLILQNFSTLRYIYI